jgi:hypothetical protein
MYDLFATLLHAVENLLVPAPEVGVEILIFASQ